MTQTFKPGPTLQQPLPNDDPAPKRRGRPPGSKNKNSGTRARSGSLVRELEATLTMFNMPVAMFAPTDALDITEITLLASALDEQARANPRFRKMLEGALAVSGGTNLIAVVAMIGARRAARHGILPREFDAQLRGIMAMATGKPASFTPPADKGTDDMPIPFPSVGNGAKDTETSK